MPKWTKVRFLYSNSLGIPNLGDNPNNNTTLFDTSYWIYYQLFKSNRQSTGSADPRVYLGIPFTRVTVNLD